MDVKCFVTNEHGVEIVNLTKSPHNNNCFLVIHQRVSSLLCASGFLLNCLLALLIVKSPANMKKMCPILWFGLVVDLILSGLNFMSAPFANASYGRGIAIANGAFEFKDGSVNALMMGLIGWIALSSWVCLPSQFFYRLTLVKHGSGPEGTTLVVFVMLVTLVVCCSFVIAVYFYADSTNKEFVRETINILEHVGYTVPAYKITGASITSSRTQLYMSYFTVLMFATYVALIFCALKIRKFLKKTAMSNATKRLNADMDRVLTCLAITPILTSIVPVVYITFGITICRNYPLPNVLLSWLLVTAPILNSSMTVYFIRPYRATVLGWLNAILYTKVPNNTSTNFMNSSRANNNDHHKFSNRSPQ